MTRIFLAALAFGLLLSGSSHGASAPDAGTPFAPAAASKPVYASQAPEVDPARQTHFVEAADGVDIYVETWLPAPKDGNVPPARVPVILLNTPYEDLVFTTAFGDYSGFARHFTAHGYAFAIAHVRGTARSGGCLEGTSTKQIDDGARVIEYLGRDAPWSDGNVGMWGVSYDAETQISVAALGDPAKTKYLKAIIPIASVLGQYEYNAFDGVPWTIYDSANDGLYLVNSTAPAKPPAVNPAAAEKPACQPEQFAAGADLSGDFTPFWQVREYRDGLRNVRAAVLSVHGLADVTVRPVALAGFLDRLPDDTPHKGLYGVWGHALPDSGSLEPDWQRADYQAMEIAWYDRWLKGLPTGVEDWPEIQVQDSQGQWREEPAFPTTGGPVAALALGADGALGATVPTGSTTFNQLSQVEAINGLAGDRSAGDLERSSGVASFQTPALSAPLRLTGQPVADLWVRLSEPDAHVAAVLEAVGADGQPLPHSFNFGLRSARHLEPIVDGRFGQERSQDPPVGEPIRVQVRLHPTDVVVPDGGSLRLTVAGSAFSFTPSGSAADVEILHDCEHSSALRFLMPRTDARLLNVREKDEPSGEPLAATTPGPLVTDAGGLATAAVCGRKPERIDLLGPERNGSGTAKPAKGKPKGKGKGKGNGKPRARLRVIERVLRVRSSRVRVRVRPIGGAFSEVRATLRRRGTVVARSAAVTGVRRDRTLVLRLARGARTGRHVLVLAARGADGRPTRQLVRVALRR